MLNKINFASIISWQKLLLYICYIINICTTNSLLKYMFTKFYINFYTDSISIFRQSGYNLNSVIKKIMYISELSVFPNAFSCWIIQDIHWLVATIVTTSHIKVLEKQLDVRVIWHYYRLYLYIASRLMVIRTLCLSYLKTGKNCLDDYKVIIN